MHEAIDFIGRIMIDPPLNPTETAHLAGIAARSGWRPSRDGTRLTVVRRPAGHDHAAWLSRLIEHFLTSGAVASRRPRRPFTAFSFDHVLTGTVVGCRRESQEVFVIRAEGDLVTVDDVGGRGVVPRQRRAIASRGTARTEPRGPAVVIDLATRRKA